MNHADTSLDGVIRDGRHHMQIGVYYHAAATHCRFAKNIRHKAK